MKRVRHSLQTLRIFVLVSRTRSVSAAAAELAMTQGAVTKHIHALEAMLGTELFERLPQGMRLTPKGKGYCRSVSRAIEMLDRAADALLPQPVAGAEVLLGAAPAVVQRWLIPNLGEFEAQRPDIGIKLVPRLGLEQARQTLCYAEIRFGTGRFPGWRSSYLVGRRYGIAMAPALAKRLARRGVNMQGVTQGLLDAAPLLTHVLGPTLWDEALASLGMVPGVGGERIACEQYSVLIPAAVAGRGIALVPLFLLTDELAQGHLVVLEPQVECRLGFHLLVPRSNAPNPAVDALAQWLMGKARHADAVLEG